jgi:hypothetical protein
VRIARGIASVFIPALALGPAPVEDTEPAVRALARKVLRQIAAGKPDPELFTPDARASLSPDRIQALSARIGALSLPPALIASMELLDCSEERELRVYRYALTDLTATAVFTMRLAQGGKIASVELSPGTPAP